MIPSRGVHALRAKAPRSTLIQQCRHLSSTSRPHLRSPLLHQTANWTTRRTTAAPLASSLLKISSIRHASTDTTPTDNAVPPPSEFPNLDTINLDNLTSTITSSTHLPTETGYLHSLGIDYGIGPTSLVQFVLENIHVHTGLPWWATILSTAFLLRLAAFPLFLKSSDSMARQAALATVLKPYNEAYMKAQKAGDTQGILLAMNQKSAIHKKAGISQVSQFVPMVVQGVIGFCGYRLMKAMVDLPVPGLVDGGFLWLKDLTLTDGYLLMPLFMAGTMHIMARFGGESGTAALPPQMKTAMLYFMPGFIALFTAWQPGAVCLWFCGSGALGLAQGQLLQRKAVRKFFGLAPMYKPKPGEEVQNPFTAMLDQMSGKKPEGTPQPTPSGGAAPRGPSGAHYMNPQYQAPNVSRSTQSQGRTIDANLVSRKGTAGEAKAAEDVVQPGQKSKGGILDSAKAFKARVLEAAAQTPEKKRELEQASFKKAAQAYEKRAKERGR